MASKQQGHNTVRMEKEGVFREYVDVYRVTIGSSFSFACDQYVDVQY